MARFGMVIDTKLCVGCMDCVVACKTENDVPEGLCRDWITEEVKGKFPDTRLEIRSERCNHCWHFSTSGQGCSNIADRSPRMQTPARPYSSLPGDCGSLVKEPGTS